MEGTGATARQEGCPAALDVMDAEAAVVMDQCLCFRELKVGPGMQVGFTHGLDKFLGPGARAQELVLPFAGHVGEQEGEASAG